jgi:hypothetical protein
MMTEEKTQTEQNLDEAAHVRYLANDEFVLFRNESGMLKLTLKDDRSFLRVTARRMFPFSFPTKYISLRAGNEEEIGIISDLASLSKEYRHWIEHELEMRYYTPRLHSINFVRRRFGGIEWSVETDCGPKRIITKNVHDTLAEVEPGRYVITDVEGNRYELMVEKLDEPSKARFDKLV